MHARGYCSKHYYRWQLYGSPYKTKWRPKGSGQIFHGYKVIYINQKPIREHRYIMEQKEKKRIKNMFQHYISVPVVNELLKKPDMLSLGGERKYATAFFFDFKNLL